MQIGLAVLFGGDIRIVLGDVIEFVRLGAFEAALHAVVPVAHPLQPLGIGRRDLPLARRAYVQKIASAHAHDVIDGGR